MSSKKGFLAAVACAALSFALPAGATEILTTSYSAWFATTTGSVTEWDFNIPSNTYNTASGYSMTVGSYGPINITGPDGSGFILQKNPGYGTHSYITLQSASDGIGDMYFQTPAAGITAFEIVVGITGNAAPISIKLSDGETFTASPTVGGLATIGLSSGTAITSFTLSTASGSQVQLADFYAGISTQPADVGTPTVECATAIMIGSGLILFGGCRKVYSNFSGRNA